MFLSQIFLLLGSPDKLVLEYEWVDVKVHKNVFEYNTSLTNMLRRLVQLAGTEFADYSKSKSVSTMTAYRVTKDFDRQFFAFLCSYW